MYWNDLNTHLKRQYGCKVYKLALSSGCSCPNRDGTLGVRGCIFCDGAGAPTEPRRIFEGCFRRLLSRRTWPFSPSPPALTVWGRKF